MAPRKKKNPHKKKPYSRYQNKNKHHRVYNNKKPSKIIYKTPQEKLDEFIKSENGFDDHHNPYASYYQMWINNFVISSDSVPEEETINIKREGLSDKSDNGDIQTNNNNPVNDNNESDEINEIKTNNDVNNETVNENNDKSDENDESDENENIEKLNEENHFSLDSSKWYGKSTAYWDGIEPTVNGMLGGFESISKMDLKGSLNFLNRFKTGKQDKLPPNPIALDVGAGIGRISKHLLFPNCSSVDLLEQNPKFLQKAKEDITLSFHQKIGDFFCCPIQEFEFNRKYDIIWIQWVIIYLTDDDFIQFMIKCKNSLTENGIIFLKDNVLEKGFCLDTSDSSVTRSERHLKLLFEVAGLTLLKEETQRDFPPGLYPVKSFALK